MSTAPTYHTYHDGDRGNRLSPGRLHPRYSVLRSLVREMRRVVRLPAFPTGETILDYGCGNKPYEPLFAGKFERYVGADLPGNPQAELTTDPDGMLPVDEGTADCVLSTQVLEHVRDPERYLAEAYRVLHPGGTLVLTTHGIWTYHPDPTDYWRWTPDGLQLIVEQAGFRLHTMRSVMSTASVAVQLWQDATKRRVPGSLRPAYEAALQRLIGLLERLRGDQFSSDASVYVLLAKKPS